MDDGNDNKDMRCTELRQARESARALVEAIWDCDQDYATIFAEEVASMACAQNVNAHLRRLLSIAEAVVNTSEFFVSHK